MVRAAAVAAERGGSQEGRQEGKKRTLRGVVKSVDGLWRGTLHCGSTVRHLGFFATPEAAAKARDRAAT